MKNCQTIRQDSAPQYWHRWCICCFGMPLFQILGMECFEMVWKFGFDEGVWPSASNTARFSMHYCNKVSHIAIALCCWNFTRDRLAQFMRVKGSTLNAGLKHSDVISPILFNAGLEHAMRRNGTSKLFHHGVQLGHGNRLTNIPYADDLMLLYQFFTWFDLYTRLKFWIPELAVCGLQLNSAKTKILTTSPSENLWLCWCMWRDDTICSRRNSAQIFGPQLRWKFFGQEKFWICTSLAGCLEQIHKYKHILLNKHVSLFCGLKLFDAVVFPAMLFGLATLPLTKGCLQKLGVVQKWMLRSIVGWIWIHDDLSWRDIMVQMNHELAIAKTLFQWRVGQTDSSDRSSACTSDCTLTWKMAG